MKNRLVFAFFAAAGVVAVLAGCSSVGVGAAPNEPTSKSETQQAEETPADEKASKFSLPVSSETTTYGLPWEVGEYRLLTQPEARSQSICALDAPWFDDGTYMLTYLNEDARLLLAERDAQRSDFTECRWIGPDSQDPYDESVIGLVQIYVTPSKDTLAINTEGIEECVKNSDGDISDCGKADRSEDVFECKSWDDGQFSACDRIFESTGALYNARGNFSSGEEGEKILTAFLEAIATPTFPN